MIIELHGDHPEPRKIKRAVEALIAGQVIAYPTDTCYALGCDLHQRGAIESLYRIKGMARTQPLAFICPDLSDISRYASIDNHAHRLLRRMLPGPYTFILPATRETPKLLWSKQKTIGLRVPAHPVPIALAHELGHPMLSTTAAPHGEPPLIDVRDIDARFPGISVILDGGYGGEVPTTVVDLVENVVVREGAGPIDKLFE
jgi:tRNA threonylcarbamoyl adenosine modification protein (Sua5/YciO/YrdC/YwlC family)